VSLGIFTRRFKTEPEPDWKLEAIEKGHMYHAMKKRALQAERERDEWKDKFERERRHGHDWVPEDELFETLGAAQAYCEELKQERNAAQALTRELLEAVKDWYTEDKWDCTRKTIALQNTANRVEAELGGRSAGKDGQGKADIASSSPPKYPTPISRQTKEAVEEAQRATSAPLAAPSSDMPGFDKHRNPPAVDVEDHHIEGRGKIPRFGNVRIQVCPTCRGTEDAPNYNTICPDCQEPVMSAREKWKQAFEDEMRRAFYWQCRAALDEAAGDATVQAWDGMKIAEARVQQLKAAIREHREANWGLAGLDEKRARRCHSIRADNDCKLYSVLEDDDG